MSPCNVLRIYRISLNTSFDILFYSFSRLRHVGVSIYLHYPITEITETSRIARNKANKS